MIKKGLNINIGGTELVIDGNYYPLLNDTDQTTPPEAASFEIESVFLGKNDITCFLTELELMGFMFERLEYECLVKILDK